VHIEVTEATEPVDVVPNVDTVEVNVDTDDSTAAIFALAVVKSVWEAFSPTLVSSVDIWLACAIVPKVPAAPIPRLSTD